MADPAILCVCVPDIFRRERWKTDPLPGMPLTGSGASGTGTAGSSALAKRSSEQTITKHNLVNETQRTASFVLVHNETLIGGQEVCGLHNKELIEPIWLVESED